MGMLEKTLVHSEIYTADKVNTEVLVYRIFDIVMNSHELNINYK